MNALLIISLCAVTTGLLTKLVLLFAPKVGLVDVPNARSLHDDVVPRGGGIAIVVIVVTVQSWIAYKCSLTPTFTITWIGIGLGFAFLGLLDDRISLGALPRFVMQIMLSVAFVYYCVDLSLLGAIFPQVVLFAMAVITCVWFVNLFNFIDGADGLLASQTFVISLVSALIIGVSVAKLPALLMIALAGSCIGFLYWNWSPARIFMGDVGSYFLGYQIAATILLAKQYEVNPLIALILAAPLVIEASFTLLRRFIARESWWSAHRSHVYQLYITRGYSHRQVAVSGMLWVVVALGPAAWLIERWPARDWIIAAIAYAITSMMWIVLYCRITKAQP